MPKEAMQCGRIINHPDIARVSQVDEMNLRRRLPVIILVDTSSSMRPFQGLLHNAVVSLYDSIMKDEVASVTVELSVIEFNSYVNILVPFSEVYTQEDRGQSIQFNCDGQTLTGLALREALSQLEARREALRKAGIGRYAPILFLISDGQPYCSIRDVKRDDNAALLESLQKIQDMVRGNHLNVVCVEVGERCDRQLMRQLTGRADEEQAAWVKSIDASSQDLTQYFTWMSQYIRLSSSGGAVTPT